MLFVLTCVYKTNILKIDICTHTDTQTFMQKDNLNSSNELCVYIHLQKCAAHKVQVLKHKQKCAAHKVQVLKHK